MSRIHPSSALPTAADRRLPFARDCDARGATITPSSAVTRAISHLDCVRCLLPSSTRPEILYNPNLSRQTLKKALRSSSLRISEAISIGPDRQRLSPACDAPGPADCYSTFHLGTTESQTLTCPPRTGLWPTQRHQKRGLSDRAIPLLDSLATQTADWNDSTALVRLSMTWGRGRQTPSGGPRMAAPPWFSPSLSVTVRTSTLGVPPSPAFDSTSFAPYALPSPVIALKIPRIALLQRRRQHVLGLACLSFLLQDQHGANPYRKCAFIPHFSGTARPADLRERPSPVPIDFHLRRGLPTEDQGGPDPVQ